VSSADALAAADNDDLGDLGDLDEDERAALEAELNELEKAEEARVPVNEGGVSSGPGGALAG
jgi:hypothetical protein